MSHGHSHTAILVFALSPSAETERKPMREGKSLFREMTRHTLFQVRKTGLPYFHYPERLQEGNSFGERFSNAIAALFEQGYSNVITIGNDCPQLHTHHLLEAARSLEKGKTIIAPSFDGGFNLLGLTKTSFSTDRFQQLPWQSSQLFTHTLYYFKELGCVPHLMEALSDIDSMSDVALLTKGAKWLGKTLLALLRTMVQGQTKQWVYNELSPIAIHGHIPPNKGSPLKA